MTKLNLNLPTTITVALGKDSGNKLAVETARLPANVVEAIAVAGIKVILTNCFNGGGKDAKTEDKVAAVQKKLDAWYRGEFNVVARGDSVMTALREAYVDDVRAKTGASLKDVEQSIKAAVQHAFGETESATFGRFIDAMAQAIAREEHGKDATDEQIAGARDAFEAHYQALADEAAKRRTDAGAKVDLLGINLAMFKKAEPAS